MKLIPGTPTFIVLTPAQPDSGRFQTLDRSRCDGCIFRQPNPQPPGIRRLVEQLSLLRERVIAVTSGRQGLFILKKQEALTR